MAWNPKTGEEEDGDLGEQWRRFTSGGLSDHGPTVHDVSHRAVVRYSAQVFLSDEGDRVLLLRSDEPGTTVSMWGPVGGGVEPGEDVYAAARREVAEETGLLDVDIGPEIWRRRHKFVWQDVLYDSRERWFMARVTHFSPTAEFMTDAERAYHAGHRWWSPDDLATTSDRFTPCDLPARVIGLLIKGAPGVPAELSH